ncbi:MAG: hypothetical protein JST28_03835 [Acidobacteria bacterium]|nr:hypothetical protein [Acidobacteriota bacterium]
MHIECRHVFSSGCKCTDAILRDSQFCYHHRNLRERFYAPAHPGTPFRMPLLEDADGCVIGVQETLWAMGEKRITQKEAGTYLHGINIIKGLLPKYPAVTPKPVRSLCYDDHGFEMAEAVNACDPPRDCVTCQKPCEWFEYYEDEVEEIEDQIAEEEKQKNLEEWKAANPGMEPPPELQPAPEPDRPRKGKYDNEDPAVRAICEFIEEREYKELLELQALEKARVESAGTPETPQVAPQEGLTS